MSIGGYEHPKPEPGVERIDAITRAVQTGFAMRDSEVKELRERINLLLTRDARYIDVNKELDACRFQIALLNKKLERPTKKSKKGKRKPKTE